ncbi:uncharacterized protein LOC105845403 [Hydra vulgaris]|uniref:uncharacterized protein LOC105845403 n=1 Tax=Hydra vulgaris TaxID=6087 RepID=UPI00064148D5|nr:uncharacterized protein LOC105845403 [Hydra vulgaris]
MFALVADYKSSESSSSSENEEIERPTKLPLPSLSDLVGEKSSYTDLQKRKLINNSVYMNPYLKAEEESLSKLSKHRPLVDIKPEVKKEKHFSKKKNKLKLCAYFFKHGTCKFADQCKFLHSLQNNLETEKNKASFPEASLSKETTVSKKSIERSSKIKNIAFLENAELAKVTNISETDDSIWENKKIHTKKRVGLTDNIVPPKKALKAYKMTQQ